MAEHLLIVDDDKDFVETLSTVMGHHGFKADAEFDGERALARIRKEAFDLVILDLSLPGMSGMEVCRRLRKDPKTATLPVVMATAMADEGNKILGLELGADDYITKPFNSKELVARIKAVLRRAAAPSPPAPELPLPAEAKLQDPALERQRRAAFDAYARAIPALQDGFKKGPGSLLGIPAALNSSVLECLALLEENPNPLLAVAAHSAASCYLCVHSMNASIFTMHLGLGLGWSRGAVHRLGLGAGLHELRLAASAGLPIEPASSADGRSWEMLLHPLEGRDIPGHLLKIEETLRQPLPEFPGAPSEGIPDLVLASHAIGICDIYETLSRVRAWREPFLPHDAVKVILREYAREFDRRAVKAFIERFTPYPPGSYLKLSSGEIACVIAVDPRAPLLPTVAVSVDSAGKPPPSPTFLDLAQARTPTITIVRPVDQTKLRAKGGKIIELLPPWRS